jgi:hypothetical protein
MAELTAKKRNRLKKSQFGLPGERAYPVDTRGRAANAKARATQMVKAGKLSESSAAKIRAKADRVLGEGRTAAGARHLEHEAAGHAMAKRE